MGIVTTSSGRTFTRSPELLYDFVSNPANWTKTYPGGPQIRNLPAELPLNTWDEAHPDPEKDRVFTWQLAMAMRPRLFVFSSVGRLGHDSAGDGGLEGRMTIEYHFTQPDEGVTLFTHHDDRSVQRRAAVRQFLPDGQSGAHRRLSRRHRARACRLMQRPSQRRAL